jgi:Protein of unknown function (DUF3768)
MHRITRIRDLNDAFRQTFRGGTIWLTEAVTALPEAEKRAVLKKVQTCARFDNSDSLGEHERVSVEHLGQQYVARIDYYSLDLRRGSDDPADPSRTVRVLTIMRADER